MYPAPARTFASPFSTRLIQKDRAKKVVLLGAGLAGLSAAYVLKKAGHDVTVLEARDRPGGRVETLRSPFPEDLYAEAGAVFIPPWHHLVRAYAEEFGLSLTPMPDSPPAATVWYLKNRRVVGPCHPSNSLPVELSPQEAKIVDGSPLGVFELFRIYLPQDLMDLVQDWGGAPPVPPELKEYDDQSFMEYLESRGASSGAIELMRLGYFDLWGDGIESVSALLLLRDFALNATPPHLRIRSHRAGITEAGGDGPGTNPDSNQMREGEKEEEGVEAFTITGGNDQLPRAFAERLGASVRYRSPVVRIHRGQDEVEVVCEGPQGMERFSAEQVICTIPFSVLRNIPVDPPLSAGKRSAIEGLPYTAVNRTYVPTETRLWTSPTPVDGEDQIPYGSGNTDLLGQWLHDATAFQTGPAGILEFYRTGARAMAADGMSEAGRVEASVENLRRVYPGIQPIAGADGFKSWTRDPWSLGGYCWFRPGQMQELMPDIATPDGRLHFAGDHTSPAPGWMEGAIESGHRAAHEVNEAD